MGMNTSTENYRTILRERFSDFRNRYHVASLELFGSRVNGAHQTDSDLDVLVQFDTVPSLFTLVEFENELSDLLGVKIDLVLRDSLKPNIGKRIIHDAVPL